MGRCRWHLPTQNLLCEKGLGEWRVHSARSTGSLRLIRARTTVRPGSTQGTHQRGSREMTLGCMTLTVRAPRTLTGLTLVKALPLIWAYMLDLNPIWTHYGTSRSPVLNTGPRLLNSEFRYFINDPFQVVSYVLCPRGFAPFRYWHACARYKESWM